MLTYFFIKGGNSYNWGGMLLLLSSAYVNIEIQSYDQSLNAQYRVSVREYTFCLIKVAADSGNGLFIQVK